MSRGKREKSRVVEGEVVEPGWSKLKISVGVLIVILIVVGFFATNKSARDMFLPTSITHQQVAGVQTEKAATASGKLSSKALQDKINKIKDEVSHINVVDVTTHSPQVQKVLNDLKALEGVPGNQAKGVCESICKGL